MRIYDHHGKQALKYISLFLTPDEAKELADPAADLAAHPEKHHHHIGDSDYQHEIVLAVYTPENHHQFDPESRRIINEA